MHRKYFPLKLIVAVSLSASFILTFVLKIFYPTNYWIALASAVTLPLATLLIIFLLYEIR